MSSLTLAQLMTRRGRRFSAGWPIGTLTIAASIGLVSPAEAQLSGPSPLFEQIDQVARLEDQLINRLRAVQPSQRDYIRYVVKLVDQGKLETSLVVAIERYALQRNPRYPFPFFERALNHQATQRGIPLPSIIHFQSAAFPIAQP